MKKIFIFAALSVAAMQLRAQDAVNLDTYIGAQLATEDLNGTARYVGMGGAMEALGADISTIGTNPAGIGLFRHSQVSGSFGLVSQSDGKSFADGSKISISIRAAISTMCSRLQLMPLMAHRRIARLTSRA